MWHSMQGIPFPPARGGGGGVKGRDVCLYLSSPNSSLNPDAVCMSLSLFPLDPQMLYVSSAVGLYFPNDFCLYPGMSSLVTFGLKFIPSALALIIAVIVTTGTYVVRYD